MQEVSQKYEDMEHDFCEYDFLRGRSGVSSISSHMIAIHIKSREQILQDDSVVRALKHEK